MKKEQHNDIFSILYLYKYGHFKKSTSKLFLSKLLKEPRIWLREAVNINKQA